MHSALGIAYKYSWVQILADLRIQKITNFLI